ncbi:putative C2 domain-containing protein [Phytophthora cinnamomi]|uniref:putative C2 domain-containing protein n=1 Tax=Phytophthora cinnamomi TaxID=4785 RepID=UPI003559C669|nr:putative C2 domain-containing protein [Phytophthora cinnamomi]
MPAAAHATPSLFPLPSDELDLPEGAVLDVELEIVSAKNIVAGDYLGVMALMKGQLSSSDAYAIIENVRPDSLCKLYLFGKDVNADDELGETQFTAVNTDSAVSTFELAISLNGRNAGTIVIKVKSHSVEPMRRVLLHEVGPVPATPRCFSPQKNWTVNGGVDKIISALESVKESYPTLSPADLVVQHGSPKEQLGANANVVEPTIFERVLVMLQNKKVFSLHELSRATIEARHNSDVESDESDNEFDD